MRDNILRLQQLASYMCTEHFVKNHPEAMCMEERLTELEDLIKDDIQKWKTLCYEISDMYRISRNDERDDAISDVMATMKEFGLWIENKGE